MKKILYSLFLAVLSSACGNGGEIAYNETAARLYYEVSDSFEQCYTTFKNGEYTTKFEYEFGNAAFDGSNLKKSVRQTRDHFALLRPSDKAAAFHAGLNEYFNLVGDDFADALISYTDLDCDCPQKRDSIGANIDNLYRRISSVEDECLEIQKKYMEAIGGKGQTR